MPAKRPGHDRNTCTIYFPYFARSVSSENRLCEVILLVKPVKVGGRHDVGGWFPRALAGGCYGLALI